MKVIEKTSFFYFLFILTLLLNFQISYASEQGSDLSSAEAARVGRCVQVARALNFTEAAALNCLNGCNVYTGMIEPILKRSFRPGSIHSEVTLISGSNGSLGEERYHIEIFYAQKVKSRISQKLISRYDVLMTQDCLIKSVNRIED